MLWVAKAFLLQDDYYQFNWSLDYEYDVESFTSAVDRAQKAKEPRDKINYLKTAVESYKGDYLSEIEEIGRSPTASAITRCIWMC